MPDKCPCENCIVFVMCKQRLMMEYSSQVIQLSKSCAHLKNYVGIQSDNTMIARKTFGLHDWKSRLKP